MAANKALEDARAITVAVPAGVISGEPILVGVLAGVAQTSRSAATGNASVDFQGAYFLEVLAATTISPLAGSAVAPGDAIYADGGTLDSGTNVTQGFTLDKNASGTTFFGNALDALASGSTGTIRVRLGGKAA